MTGGPYYCVHCHGNVCIKSRYNNNLHDIGYIQPTFRKSFIDSSGNT